MTPKRWFVICLWTGFSLWTFLWIFSGASNSEETDLLTFTAEETMGYFLALIMICMTLLRRRVKDIGYTTIIDGVLCLVLFPAALPLVIFMGMFHGTYVILILLPLVYSDLTIIGFSALAAFCGFFLRMWDKENEKKHDDLHVASGRFYELESLQGELMAATEKIERMTTVSERARISREIHDNAGHEIVAAYITLQTARDLFPENEDTADALSLYDAALERLDSGANKIREAVHNLTPIVSLGVDGLRDICDKFPVSPIFEVFGDTTNVPVHVWDVLESCLNEALTNTTRHAKPSYVKVSVDATPNLVRLCVENDGTADSGKPTGNGLRNLRYRLSAVGGSISSNPGEVFTLVCVIPFKRAKGE